MDNAKTFWMKRSKIQTIILGHHIKKLKYLTSKINNIVLCPI